MLPKIIAHCLALSLPDRLMRLIPVWLQFPISLGTASYRLKSSDPLAALTSDECNTKKVQKYSNTEGAE
jgi:hypothetical protein